MSARSDVTSGLCDALDGDVRRSAPAGGSVSSDSCRDGAAHWRAVHDSQPTGGHGVPSELYCQPAVDKVQLAETTLSALELSTSIRDDIRQFAYAAEKELTL